MFSTHMQSIIYLFTWIVANNSALTDHLTTTDDNCCPPRQTVFVIMIIIYIYNPHNVAVYIVAICISNFPRSRLETRPGEIDSQFKSELAYHAITSFNAVIRFA